MVVNVGVIGLGTIWRMRHLPSLKSLEDKFQIKVVCDVREDVAKQYGQSLNVDWTTNWKDVINRSDVEAVALLTPPSFRVNPIQEVCKRGKPLYCEKPIALNIEDAKEVKKLVEDAKIPFITEFVRRHFRTTGKILDIIKSELGKPQIIWCISGPGSPTSNVGVNAWMADDGLSGGRMQETGCHYVDFINFMFDEQPATKVSGYSNRLVNLDYNQDDITTLTIEYGKKAVGELIYCTSRYAVRPPPSPEERKKMMARGESPGPRPEEGMLMNIVTANKGMIYTDFQKIIWYNSGGRQEWRPEKELNFAEVGAEIWKLFDEYIRTDKLPYPAGGLDAAYAATEYILAGYKSMKDGVKIKLPL